MSMRVELRALILAHDGEDSPLLLNLRNPVAALRVRAAEIRAEIAAARWRRRMSRRCSTRWMRRPRRACGGTRRLFWLPLVWRRWRLCLRWELAYLT